ncbi:MAG: aminoacyl-histidine dipeptidase [Bacteroidales bacterium]|nr:aminoacyl-histidine dipeptidase [Bacteroidales bacterium]
MNNKLLQLKPERLWFYFSEILEIPRLSKKEEKIAEYLMNFGKNHNLETIKDETGNILIRKPATKGNEKMKSVVLQSHMDMVGEKNADTDFNFDTDPIQARIDGEWVKATKTTLGADDGIGIAAELAILEANNIEHGPIECLFTVDEETGLTGAFGLKSGLLKSKILINLDSEDEGELFIGCAGGRDTNVEITYSKEASAKDTAAFIINISGLNGGHSGDEIQKRLGNSIKLMTRLLWNASEKFNCRISKFDGGNLRNAIPREAFAIVTVPEKHEADFVAYVNDFEKTVKEELKVTEPQLKVSIEATEHPAFVIDKDTQNKLLNSLYACPHGVIAWSANIPDFVETSTNLAVVKTLDNIIDIRTSQRSSVESAKEDACNMVASVFKLIGAKISHSDGYPGWTPNTDSEIVEITKKSYQKLFNQEPKVLAIHAGLECGLIGDTYPEMDMISFGPTIKGAHTPEERLKIDTATKFWNLTIDVLGKIPEDK